ncbi:MAG: hypothetical protein ACI9C1_002498 [Candidatus Aldehydirespiratoraceae bacterium]|jgi:hypothetical protein
MNTLRNSDTRLNPGIALRAALGPGFQLVGLRDNVLNGIVARQSVSPVDSRAIAIPRSPAAA